MANKKGKGGGSKGGGGGGGGGGAAAGSAAPGAPNAPLSQQAGGGGGGGGLNGSGAPDAPAPPGAGAGAPGAAALPAAERLAAVRPLWESLPHAERVRRLTLPLEDLRAAARRVSARARAQAVEEAGISAAAARAPHASSAAFLDGGDAAAAARGAADGGGTDEDGANNALANGASPGGGSSGAGDEDGDALVMDLGADASIEEVFEEGIRRLQQARSMAAAAAEAGAAAAAAATGAAAGAGGAREPGAPAAEDDARDGDDEAAAQGDASAPAVAAAAAAAAAAAPAPPPPNATWKLWRWPADGAEFSDADAFRAHVRAEGFRPELARLLPPHDPKAPERPAEAALRTRMGALLLKLQALQQHASAAEEGAVAAPPPPSARRGAGGSRGGQHGHHGHSHGHHGHGHHGHHPQRATADQITSAVRDANIEIVRAVIEAAEREHDAIAATITRPAAAYVCECLPSAARSVASPAGGGLGGGGGSIGGGGCGMGGGGELHFEDLDRLAPEELARLAEWLVERVDALAVKLRADVPGADGGKEGGGDGGKEADDGGGGDKQPPPDGDGAAPAAAAAVPAAGDGQEAEADEDDDDEAMGDVDLFALTPDGDALTVDPRWLGHLAARLLGCDGAPRRAAPGEDPRRCGLVLEWMYGSIVSTAEKARDGAKRPLPSRAPPTTQRAHEALARALEDQAQWELRARQARDLLAALLRSRHEAAELAGRGYDLRPVPAPAALLEPAAPPSGGERAAAGEGAGAAEAGAPAAAGAAAAAAASSSPSSPSPPPPPPNSAGTPDHVVVAMLRREAVLTQAKLHALVYDHIQGDRALRATRAQIRQAEPGLERLRRELDVLKQGGGRAAADHPPAPPHGFRTAAEAERHRHQVADAAIGEQLEAQTALRERGLRVQQLHDRRQRLEYEAARREGEVKQLQGWRATVGSLADRYADLSAQVALETAAALAAAAAAAGEGAAAAKDEQQADGTETEAAAGGDDDEAATGEAAAAAAVAPAALAQPLKAPAAVTPAALQLAKMRAHFAKDVRKQLYTDADDRAFFDRVKAEVRAVDGRLADGRAALLHLEGAMCNVACDDPGAAVGASLALPMLQERLDAAAAEFAARRAKEAEEDVIRMEVSVCLLVRFLFGSSFPSPFSRSGVFLRSFALALPRAPPPPPDLPPPPPTTSTHYFPRSEG